MLKLQFTYERVHHDCDTEGGTCEHGFYKDGWHAPTGAACPSYDGELYSLDTDWAEPEELDGRDALTRIQQVIGALDGAELVNGKLRGYSADNCAEPGDSYYEGRAFQLEGDTRLLQVVKRCLAA